MMSVATRRLVFDFHPLIVTAIAMIALAVGLSDAMWLADASDSSSYSTVLVGFAAFGSVMARLPVWRLLPVSARERSRAIWWTIVGLPGLILILLMAGGVAICAAMGIARRSGAEIFSLVIMQWSIYALLGSAALIGGPLGRRFGPVAPAILIFPLLLFFFIAAFLIRPEPGSMRETWLALAISVACATTTWIMAPEPFLATHRRKRAGGQVEVSSSGPVTGSRGWSAAMPARWYVPPALVICGGLALIIVDRVKHEAMPVALAYAPMVCAFCAYIFFATASLRTWRILPLSAFTLTLLFQGATIAVFVAGAILMAAVCALAGIESAGLFEASALMLALTTLMPGMLFRFGQKTGLILTALLYGAVPPILGAIMIGKDEGVLIPAVRPYILGISAVFILLGFLWTWLEIAISHSGYRLRPMAPDRWRSA